jgi:hypothetical protein
VLQAALLRGGMTDGKPFSRMKMTCVTGQLSETVDFQLLGSSDAMQRQDGSRCLKNGTSPEASGKGRVADNMDDNLVSSSRNCARTLVRCW